MSELLTDATSTDNLPFEDSAEEDLPFEGETFEAPSVGAKRDMEIGHAAILQNHIDGRGVMAAFAEFEAVADTNSLLSQKSAEKADADVEDLEASFIDDPGTTPTEMGQNAELVQQLMVEAQDRATNVPAQVVEAASGLGAEPAVQAKIQGQLTMLQDVHNIMKDMSKLEMVGEIAGGFLPGAAVKDNFDATGSIFGAEDVMRDMVVGFKSMTAEQQVQAWPTIRDHLLDAMPQMQAANTLAKFLDPVGEDDLGDFNAMWAALDSADLALSGFAIASRIAKLTKQLNGIRLLSKLDSKEEAASLNAAAVMDTSGDVTRKAGIDDTTVYNNSMPFNVGDLDEAYAEGLSTETLANINGVRKAQKEKVGQISRDETALREDLLDAADRPKAEEAAEKALVDQGFENINIVGRTADSTSFQYSLKVGDEVLTDVDVMDLKVSDVGIWESTENSLLPKFLNSPSAWAKGDTRDSVSQALRMDNLSSNIAEQLRRLQRDAVAPLLGTSGLKGLRPKVRAQMARVDDVLMQGDNANTVFSPTELRAGVNGTPLDDKQIEVYYNVRSLYDNLFVLRNVAERRKLTAQGMQEVNLTNFKEVGKVFDTPANAQSSINVGKSSKVYRDDTGEVISVKDLDLSTLYEQGLVLTKLKNAIRPVEGGDNFTMVLTLKNSTQKLPEQVLHFKEGYVPRVNKDAYWFLKEETSGVVDGVMQTEMLGKTHRFFDNRRDANEVLAQMQLENPGKKFVVKEDREVEQQILGGSDMGAGGGLYTGARSSKPIGFGKENMPAERFGAFESLSMNVQQLQNFISRNQWRMGMEQKWINTANSLGVKADKFDPRIAPEGTESGAFLRDMGNQIQEWSGFPSKDELIWQEKVRAVSEWALNSGLKRTNPVVSGLHYLEHTDPIAAARSAAFHSLLGFFNPAQLWVQAQGASVALSLATKLKDPAGGVRAIKNQFALMSGNLGDAPAYRARVAKSAGIDVKELDEMVELWRRTGLEESILTTADHAASIRSHGIAADALRQTADKGLFFYRGGELFNRRTSFLVALQEFKAANKGAKVTDADLKGILTRANNMMLNLSKANRSGFQKGIFSIPTQFLQVQAKMIESMLGLNGQYTRGERAKIMFGQLALYGAAGIPAGNLAIRWYMESNGLTQADVEEMNPEVVKSVNQGFWGWLALSAFGADIDIANRGAIASGVQSLTEDLLFGESTMSEKFFAAFGQVPSRFYEAYGKIKPYALYAAKEREFPAASDIVTAVRNLASVTSTWRNAEKAVFMREFDMLTDRNGYPTVQKDFNLSTEVMAALGFQPSDVGRIFDMQKLIDDNRAHRTTITNSIVQIMFDYSREVKTASSPEEEKALIEKFSNMQAILMQSLRTPRDQQLVVEAVQTKLSSGSRESKTIKNFILEFNDGRVADIHTTHASLVARGILQVTDQTGE